MEIAVALVGGLLHLHPLTPGSRTEVLPRGDLSRVVELEQDRPRWVWADTAVLAPLLLAGGVRVERCVDLRLCRTILHRRDPGGVPADPAWDAPGGAPDPARPPTLLDDLASPADLTQDRVVQQWERQQQAVAAPTGGGGLRLLLAAESVGALIAAEMRHHGLPWDREVHDRILTAALGPRPRQGARPAVLEDLAGRIRDRAGMPSLNPDSPVDVLRALRTLGLGVTSTRKWDLVGVDHPVIEPLLEYKRLSRLLAANGWTWLDSWVEPGVQGRRGRFRPDYVPGGVVTGRWATSGGGALQLPKVVRAAVRADPGWRLVIADAAQIEPRVLAAMSGDRALADAGRGGDLYAGLVEARVVATRDQAKVGMLGALYGGTSGDSGMLMPRLRRAYPRAIALVEDAARTGERGGVVSTWLGRTSPPPSELWVDGQQQAGSGDADEGQGRAARQQARVRGRFTRNFVVQGSAAEWALCWMGEIRRRIRELGSAAHLVFFLHDEVVVHAPAADAEVVAEIVREAAAAAGRLLFGETPVDFPLTVRVAEDYAEEVPSSR